MTTRGKFTETTAPIKSIHSNLDQVLINITEDKVRLVLNEHIKNVERKKDWIAPLSLLIAIVTTFATSTFKDAVFPASTWQAIFFIVGGISALWLLKAIWIALNASTIDDIVSQIKNQTNLK